MDITPRHRAAEADFRRLLDDAGLDPPDAVDYSADWLTFFWNGPKVAVIVDLDDAEAPVVETRRERLRSELRISCARAGSDH
jgi:hypothetical protein